jgi:hypothetical protein
MQEKPRYCKTKYCTNALSKKGKSPYCGKCRSRRYREKHPLYSTYLIKKYNAKRDGISFTVTYDEWYGYCMKTGYIELKGQEPTSQVIDRKLPELGYTISNMQPLTVVENGRKSVKERKNKKWTTTNDSTFIVEGPEPPF